MERFHHQRSRQLVRRGQAIDDGFARALDGVKRGGLGRFDHHRQRSSRELHFDEQRTQPGGRKLDFQLARHGPDRARSGPGGA
jgi:hypothetical protein